MRRIVLLVVVAALLLGFFNGGRAQAQGGDQQPVANLLVNASFEEPFSTTPYLKIAHGWTPWWQGNQPDYYPEIFGSRHWGDRAQALLVANTVFTAGLFQQVNVRQGLPVRASAWVNIFTCCDPNPSDTGSRMRIGIDPNGGTDVRDSDIVWSAEISPFNRYEELQVETVAAGPVVTLFLWGSQNRTAIEHRQFWDDAMVWVPGGIPTFANVLTAPRVNVNVRSGPGESFPRIGRIGPGQTYNVLGEQNGWYNIDFNGQSGYVSGQYTQVSQVQVSGAGAPAAATATPAQQPGGNPNAPGTPSGVIYLAQYNVRMRAAPNTTSQLLATIPYQTNVEVVERTSDGQWLRVNYNGQSGWVASRLGTLDQSMSLVPVATAG